MRMKILGKIIMGGVGVVVSLDVLMNMRLFICKIDKSQLQVTAGSIYVSDF